MTSSARSMRTASEIQRELEAATAKRAELWQELAHKPSTASPLEAVRLPALIEDLWSELRTARAHERFGSPDFIIRRAQRAERLDRGLRRRAERASSQEKAA